MRAWSVVLLLLASCFGGPAAPSAVAQSFRQTVQVKGHIKAANMEMDFYGSGVVLHVDEASGHSIVVTARHVTDPAYGEIIHSSVQIVELKFHIRKLAGEVCDATILHEDQSHDVAFLAVSCVAGEPATFLPGRPDVGSWVYVVGAPGGWHPDGVFAVTDGRYMGPGQDEQFFASTPIRGGNSGGGVFQNGWLAGIAVATDPDWPHIATCVPANVILTAYLQARAKFQP